MVHYRAVNIDEIHIFFILAAIYYLVRTLTNDIAIRLRQYAILGVLVGLAVSVKANAAVLLLLFPVLFLAEQWSSIASMRIGPVARRLLTTVPSAVVPWGLVFLSVF